MVSIQVQAPQQSAFTTETAGRQMMHVPTPVALPRPPRVKKSKESSRIVKPQPQEAANRLDSRGLQSFFLVCSFMQLVK